MPAIRVPASPVQQAVAFGKPLQKQPLLGRLGVLPVGHAHLREMVRPGYAFDRDVNAVAVCEAQPNITPPSAGRCREEDHSVVALYPLRMDRDEVGKYVFASKATRSLTPPATTLIEQIGQGIRRESFGDPAGIRCLCQFQCLQCDLGGQQRDKLLWVDAPLDYTL